MPISTEMKEHYEQRYANYSDAEWRAIGAQHKSGNIMQLCKSVPHDRILEIGAGDGAVLECLRNNRFGREWHALEISDSAVSLMKEKGFDAQVFDGSHVAMSDKSVDLVVMSHVVEHLEHPRILLWEAARVGAHVCIEVPLEHTVRLKEGTVYNPVGHINFFTAQTARMLLLSAGYEVIATRLANPERALLVYSQGRVKGTLHWLIRELGLKLMPGLASKVFVYHYAILARPKK